LDWELVYNLTPNEIGNRGGRGSVRFTAFQTDFGSSAIQFYKFPFRFDLNFGKVELSPSLVRNPQNDVSMTLPS
jgi:hypothetical protein